MKNFWQRLDPRRHLAAAIGWAVFMVVTAFAVGAAALAAREAENRLRADAEHMLSQIAAQIGRSVAAELRTRHSILLATAARLDAQADGGGRELPLRQRLEAVQREFPGFEWLGIADARGRVIAATGEPQPGADVAQQPWFRQALQTPGSGGSGFIPMPRLVVPPAADAAASLDALEIATPLHDAAGAASGVLAGRLSWAWVEQLTAELLNSLDGQRQLQLLLAAADDRLHIGPKQWIGRRLDELDDLAAGGRFVVGRGVVQNIAGTSARGWTFIARQDAAAALAPARATERAVFLGVLGAGVLSAAIAVWLVRLLLRRLARLALEAQALQQSGGTQPFAVPRGSDEVSRLGAILADVFARLQHERSALLQLNAELDRRVAERTERIERLADEARHAAVTRERLRLARELHDTLAHSLMALLTQVRLVRKLRARWSDAQIEDELERAEAVAASGLAEARAAINQMRHNGVREAGLGPALSELMARLRERCGIAAALRIDPEVGSLAGERAETAFRIVEEALHNIERHARAREVELLLRRLPPPATAGDGDAPGREPAPQLRVRIEIRDDGIGFDPQRRVPGHHGLRGMREQAALLDARLEIVSRVGHGACVALEFLA